MKLSVNIQSYRRPADVKTLRVYPTATVWCHAFEEMAYRKANPDARIGVIPDTLRGSLPAVKNYILHHVFGDGGARYPDACLFMDDDIYSIKMWEADEGIPLEPDALDHFIRKYTALCAEWGFWLWGINVGNDKQFYREYTPFSTTAYVSSSFACFLRANQCRYDERFPLKEDYDMTLQQCNVRRGLLRVNKAFYTKLSAKNAGGCAAYRSVPKEMEQLQELQAKWGDAIVQLGDLDSSANHLTTKRKTFDINPVIRVPIRGV